VGPPARRSCTREETRISLPKAGLLLGHSEPRVPLKGIAQRRQQSEKPRSSAKGWAVSRRRTVGSVLGAERQSSCPRDAGFSLGPV
jgi:hypothetical protein